MGIILLPSLRVLVYHLLPPPSGGVGAASWLSVVLSLFLSLPLPYITYKRHVVGPSPVLPPSLSGRTYVITGGNAGIGRSLAALLLRRGAAVVVMCRSVQRGSDALAAIADDLAEAGDDGKRADVLARSSVIQCDLTDFESVRLAAKSLVAKVRPSGVAAIILNAGIMTPNQSFVPGTTLDTMMAANHYGHFLLVRLLLDAWDLDSSFSNSSPLRIVSVTSSTHHMARSGLDVADLDCRSKPYTLFGQYSQSKLANVVFARELASRHSGSPLRSYSVHPGCVVTDVTRSLPPWLLLLYRVFPVAKAFMKPAACGCYTVAHCAASEEAGEETGLYYHNCEVGRESRWAREEGVGEKLWRVSEEKVGIKCG